MGERRFSVADELEDEDGMVMRTPLSGSLASMSNVSDLQSMHTAISGSSMSINSDATFVSTRGDLYQDTVEELQATIDALQARLEEKTMAFQALTEEAEDLREHLKTPLKAGEKIGLF